MSVDTNVPKFAPVIITRLPAGPEFGLRLAMFGGGAVTVNETLLLVKPRAVVVTITLPVAAPAGTGTTMLVSLQLVGAPAVPLKVIMLVP